MGRAIIVAARIAAALAIAGGGAWGAFFLWFRAPGGPVTAGILAGLFAAASLAALAGLFLRRPVLPAGWALLFGGLVVAFLLLPARADRDWEPEVSRTLTATLDGDRLAVRDVRVFDWRTETEFTPRWEDRSFDLATLRSVDLINSYWAGPVIAHTLLSFGFEDGRFLTVSFEIRREKGEVYSNLAGFFRQYELVVIGADDRDIVRLRTNVRGEDTQIYRVRAEPAEIRPLLEEVIRRANSVAARPVWYNSLFANCTTELFRIARTVAPGLPFDWRIILSGYLPDYVYDLKRLDTRLGFADLKARSRVSEQGRRIGDSPDFGRLVREGLPDPNR